MQRIVPYLVALLLLADSAQPVSLHAQQVGDRVVCIRNAQMKNGDAVVGTLGVGMSVFVEAVNGDWLWVSHGTAGWIQRQNVLPLDEAIQYFTDQIRTDPTNENGYYFRGNAWYYKDEFDIAVSDFNEAIRLEPQFAGAYSARGNVWLSKCEYDKAIADYTEGLRLNPAEAAISFSRGLAWEWKEDYDKAIADFNRAIQLNPKFPDPYAERGRCRMYKGEWRAAQADISQALGLDGNSFRALTNLAWLESSCPDEHYRNGKQALENATRACEVTKWTVFNSVGALAAAYAETGDFEHAVEYQKKGLEVRKVEPKAGQTDWPRLRLNLYQQQKPYRIEVATK